MKAKYKPDIPDVPIRPSCAYATELRLMPPLKHRPDWCKKSFLITNSETVRFMIRVLGGDPKKQEAWSYGTKLFNLASVNRDIFYCRTIKAWKGSDYTPESESSELRNWVLEMRRRFFRPKTPKVLNPTTAQSAATPKSGTSKSKKSHRKAAAQSGGRKKRKRARAGRVQVTPLPPSNQLTHQPTRPTK